MLTRDYSDPDWRERAAGCSHQDGFTFVSAHPAVPHIELVACDACGERVPMDIRESGSYRVHRP